MAFDNTNIDSLALEFLRLAHDIISWRIPEVRKNKWRILAKRLMASNGEDLQEYLHNIVRGVAGDIFHVKINVGRDNEKLLGKELNELLQKIPDVTTQKRLIDYIKSRAIPLVIRLTAIQPEDNDEEGE